MQPRMCAGPSPARRNRHPMRVVVGMVERTVRHVSMKSLGRRRLVAACAALAACCSAPAARAQVSPSSDAARAHTVSRVYSFTRVPVSIDRAFRLRVVVGTAGFTTAPVAIWLLNRRGDLVTSPSLVVSPAGVFAPEAGAMGSKLGCRSLPVQPETVCEARVGYTSTIEVTLPASLSAVHRVVVALVADDRTIHVDMPPPASGWGSRQTAGRVRLLRAADVADTYVSTNSQTVEHFTRATTEGGAHGSLALAALPCPSVQGARLGRGSAELTGGIRVGLNCEPGAELVAGSIARGPTRWELQGDAWGSTNTLAQFSSGVQATVSPEDIRLMVADGPF